MDDLRPAGDTLDNALQELYSVAVPASFLDNWQTAVIREENEAMNKPQKTKWNFWRTALPTAAALVLTIGAVWVGGQDTSAPSAGKTVAMTRNAKVYSMESASVSNQPSAYSAPQPEVSDALAGSGMTSGVAANVAAPQAADQRKLVRTANMSLRTAAFDADLLALHTLISKMSGYVENTYQSGDSQSGDTRTADLSIRIPSNQLDIFLDGLKGVGRVVSRSESVTDMTVQYADNQARLDTLRQKMTRLNELLANAESMADIIEIESAISDTQYMIDSYETSQRSIDRQADMSQVYITLIEDSPVAVTSEMGMGERLTAALRVSLEGIGRFFKNMLVFVVMALPVLIPVTVVMILIVTLRRRSLKRRAKSADENREEP